MSESEDKAKKLKEIQDRLAEIQGGSAKNSGKSLDSKEAEPKPSQKKESLPPPIKKEVEKPIGEKKDTVKETPTKKTAPIKEVAEKKPVEVKEDVKSTKASRQKSQEEINWKENRSRSENSSNKSRKGSKLSKVYTIISLIITLAICTYFVYSLFLNPEKTNITTKLPEDILEAAPKEDASEEALELETVVESNIVDANVVAQEVKSEKRQIEKNSTESKKDKPTKAAASTSSSTKLAVAKVPNGLIISYSSNSTKEMAAKNANMLINKGFKAAFYFMPDKNPSSPQLYKVYVGPYDSESAAMPDFKKIVQLNDKAFILRAN